MTDEETTDEDRGWHAGQKWAADNLATNHDHVLLNSLMRGALLDRPPEEDFEQYLKAFLRGALDGSTRLQLADRH